MNGCQCGDYCEWCSSLAGDIRVKPEYSTRVYDYETTRAGERCTTQAGIGREILVNVSAIDLDGNAEIWTINAYGTLHSDTVAFSTLRAREVAR